MNSNFAFKLTADPVLRSNQLPRGGGLMRRYAREVQFGVRMESKEHWERVYSTKQSNAVSWYQPHADVSLSLIAETGISLTAAIIDIGGGASTLVDDLLEKGYTNVSVLDLSEAALAVAKQRLGERAHMVKWHEADITKSEFAPGEFEVWHDRAVFHFLTDSKDRQSYVQALRYSLKIGGYVVIATFSEDGPAQCSGLPVLRYNSVKLQEAFGDTFALLNEQRSTHQTPFGTNQEFIYCRFRKIA